MSSHQSDLSTSWTVLSNPSPGRNYRTSWAHRLQKTLSQSLGVVSKFDDEGRGGEMQSVASMVMQCGLSGLLRLPDEEEAPFTNFKVANCKWKEGCSLQLVFREEEEGLGERPCLLLHKGKGSWTKTRNLQLDPSIPPSYMWIHDILAVHPFYLSSDHRPVAACVLESHVSGKTFMFQPSTVKVCLRFELQSDLLEFVSAIKSAVALEMASNDEVPCLYRVHVSRHQRIIAAQPALLVLCPSSPRPTQICLHQPLTMEVLLEIRLRDVTCIGQRLDAEQLWVEWGSPFDGLPAATLSLECEAVNMVVRSLKAALHLHLDWGEEIKQQVTDSTVAYMRERETEGTDPFEEHSSSLAVSIKSKNSEQPPAIAAVRYSTLGSEKVPAILPRESQLEDECDDMTEMKMTSFVNFADLPQAVQQPRTQKGSAEKRKYSTLPVPSSMVPRAKSSSELSVLPEASEMEDSHLSRSSSCPTRGATGGKAGALKNARNQFKKLSNRAKILPRPPSDDDMDIYSPAETPVRPASSSSEDTMFSYETEQSPDSIPPPICEN